MASSGFYIFVEDTGLITPDVQDLLTTVQNEYKAAFGDSLLLNGNTPQGVLINAEVLARVRALQLNCTVANQINPNYAGGVFFDSIAALTGTERTPATNTLVSLTLTGVSGTTIIQGSFVQDNLGNLYATTGTVTLTNGSAIINGQAVASGPIAVLPGQITTIISNTLGWETVNNPSSQLFIGTTTQSDAAARLFRQQTLALQGQSLSQAITSGVSAIPGVMSLFYQQNDSPSPQTINGVPMVANSIYLCVSGGSVDSIAMVLNQKKSGGCAYNNSMSYVSGPAQTIGSSTISGSTAGPFTITGCTTMIGNNSITSVSSTSGVFIGQAISGTGIVSGSTVVSFVANTSINISLPATASNTGVTITLGGSNIFTTSSTAHTFVGQTISGTGIPTGTTITAIVPSTSLTMSAVATASGSITATLGATPFVTGIIGSPTITLGGSITDFLGYIPVGSTVVGIIDSSTIQISNLVTGNSGYEAVTNCTTAIGSPNITTVSSTTGIVVGQAVYGVGIPVGSSVLSFVTDTSVTIDKNATVNSSTATIYFGDTINVFSGIPQDIVITDPYSGQEVDVLFDTPALIPILVQVTAHANSSIRNLISVIQNAVVNYANGAIANDPGLGVGVDVSCFNIAGAISILEPSVYIESVEISLVELVPSYSSGAIEILPFQQATVALSSVSVVLV